MSGTDVGTTFKVEHVVTDRDGWYIFNIADESGYTKRYDTVRVGTYNNKGDYRVEVWRDGWKHLLSGDAYNRESIEWSREGARNAARILYG